MIEGYLGLGISFIIIVIIMLLIMLKAKAHILTKIVLITIAIWYGLVLFYVGPNLMGWPAQGEIPKESILLSWKVTEPKKNHKGGIYFWVLSPDKKIETKHD